jgi:hypothetical protein
MSDQDQVQSGHAGDDQPWREERHQPEPEAIEGLHAGRRVPQEKQRHPADDTQVGATSRVEGDDAGGGRGMEGGLSTGTSFGGEGQGHQGSSHTVGAHESTTHAHGHGRDTEGAFGEQETSANANNLSDYRDAGIAKNELGPSGHDNRAPHADRTEGGHS